MRPSGCAWKERRRVRRAWRHQKRPQCEGLKLGVALRERQKQQSTHRHAHAQTHRHTDLKAIKIDCEWLSRYVKSISDRAAWGCLCQFSWTALKPRWHVSAVSELHHALTCMHMHDTCARTDTVARVHGDSSWMCVRVSPAPPSSPVLTPLPTTESTLPSVLPTSLPPPPSSPPSFLPSFPTDLVVILSAQPTPSSTNSAHC